MSETARRRVRTAMVVVPVILGVIVLASCRGGDSGAPSLENASFSAIYSLESPLTNARIQWTKSRGDRSRIEITRGDGKSITVIHDHGTSLFCWSEEQTCRPAGEFANLAGDVDEASSAIFRQNGSVIDRIGDVEVECLHPFPAAKDARFGESRDCLTRSGTPIYSNSFIALLLEVAASYELDGDVLRFTPELDLDPAIRPGSRDAGVLRLVSLEQIKLDVTPPFPVDDEPLQTDQFFPGP